MFETIVTPRKVITSDVAKSYPFKDPHLDLYDVKQGRQLIQTYKEYRKNCFLKGFKVSNLLQDETKSFDAFLSMVLNDHLRKTDYMVRIYDNPLKEFGIWTKILLLEL